MTSDKCAVVFVDSRHRPIGKTPCSRWMRCLIWIAVLASLSTAVVCLGVCMLTLQTVSDLELRLALAEGTLIQDGEARASSEAQTGHLNPGLTSMRTGHGRSKRNLRPRPRRNRRGRRRRGNSNQRHQAFAFVHLVGTTHTHDHARFSGGNFQWGNVSRNPA
ncbi:hypothetical protein EGW08_021570, partial [Elysia chlorotica]